MVYHMGRMRPMSEGNDSATRAIDRFDTARSAAKYPAAYGTKHRDVCEKRALERALGVIPRGASVLDLPCGTGRLTGILLDRGYRVTGADSSPNMVDRARSLWAGHPVVWDVQNALHTSYADGEFDAVVSNRLFHHFIEESVRRRALAEFARIAKGPLVVSFFNLASLGAWSRRIRYAIRGQEITDRVAIPVSAVRADCEALGLLLERVVLSRPFLAQQAYAVITRGGR
jgi:SAM-dependent methyltransferase